MRDQSSGACARRRYAPSAEPPESAAQAWPRAAMPACSASAIRNAAAESSASRSGRMVSFTAARRSCLVLQRRVQRGRGLAAELFIGQCERGDGAEIAELVAAIIRAAIIFERV